MESEHGSPRKQQSTHWYRVGGTYSYTADPRQADVGEVGRVGLHSCEELGCEETHAGNAFEYSLWLLQNYVDGARVASGGHWP